MGEYDTFNGMSDILIIAIVIMFAVLAILSTITYAYSSDTCSKFGGKMSDINICVKNGIAYDIVPVSPFSLKMQVVRRAVDIEK